MKNQNCVTVYWQDNVLFHKKTVKFVLGEDVSIPLEKTIVDFIMPVEKLGINHWTLLDQDTVYVPPGAKATCEDSFIVESTLDIKSLKRIEIQMSDFRILVQNYEEDFVPARFDFSDTISNKVYVGLSAVGHVMLLAALAFFVPPLGITDAEAANKDQMFLMQQYLKASAEREQELKEESSAAEDAKPTNEGGTGTRAIGEEGSMGNPNSRQTNRSYAIQGSKDNKDIHIARENALREASTFGMIGLLNTGAGGDPNAPTAPWGRDDSLGADAFSARGNMWGDAPGEAFGSGGLGLSGIGDGGGGKGEGIGLGSVGTIGHGSGLGDKQGFGNGHGHLSGGHKVKVPTTRFGQTIVNGRLPAEVIQRIVRQNYGRFRACYENGLRSNPNLQGRVSVRFVIGRDGAVSNVSNGGSDLPDPAVTQCVIRSYYGLSFPSPENGIVTVTYPIMFSAQ